MHSQRMQKAWGRQTGWASRLHNVSYATFCPDSFRGVAGGRELLRLLLLLPLLLAPGWAYGADQPVWGYLDNGLGYILLESHAAPLIGSSVIVHSGSAREEFATSGASHFLEHLLFNGTETRTQEQLYDAVDALGGYNNATTRRTHVAYMMLTPAEKIREGLEIQADMLFRSTLPQEKLEKERGILLEELAKDRDQGSFELERILRLAAFGPTGPGLPILGSELSIRTMAREAIAGFYERLYTPQNMTLFVIGDFEPQEMETAIREIFGSQPPGDPPPPYRYPDLRWDGRAIVSAYDGNTLVLEWTAPGPDPGSRDFIAYECLVDLISGSDAAPLNQALRERFTGRILSSGGSIEMIPGRSFLHFRVEADPGVDWRQLAEAVPAILASSAVKPSAEDVEAWKVARETEEFFLREKPHYYPIIRGEEIAVQGIEGILDLPARLASLSAADLQQATFGIQGNAYRLAVAVPRSPAAAEDSTTAPAAQVVQTTLDNGAEILVLSSPESPVLALHLFLLGRSEAEPEGMDGAVELLQRLMSVRTQRSDAATLQRKIQAIGAQLKTADNPYIPYDDFYSTSRFSYVRLQSLDRYAEEAFSLLAELLAPPAWTDEEFEEERRATLSLAERNASASRVASRALVRASLYGGTLRARSVFGTPEDLRAMTADALRELAARYFVGRRILLVVATSLDPKEVEAMARQHLGTLPPGQEPANLGSPSDPLGRIRAGLLEQEPRAAVLDSLPLPDSTWLRMQEVGARQARLTWVRPLGRVEAERLPALKVWNAGLSNQIQFQLREREGLAYSIGSSIERLEDGTILWVASAGAAAASLPRILEGFSELLAAALQAPPDSSTVARQGIQLYGRSLMRRATRMNRAYAAGLAVMEGRDPAGIDEEIRAPMRVTPAEIARVLPALRGRGPSLLVVIR